MPTPATTARAAGLTLARLAAAYLAAADALDEERGSPPVGAALASALGDPEALLTAAAVTADRITEALHGSRPAPSTTTTR